MTFRCAGFLELTRCAPKQRAPPDKLVVAPRLVNLESCALKIFSMYHASCSAVDRAGRLPNGFFKKCCGLSLNASSQSTGGQNNTSPQQSISLNASSQSTGDQNNTSPQQSICLNNTAAQTALQPSTSLSVSATQTTSMDLIPKEPLATLADLWELIRSQADLNTKFIDSKLSAFRSEVNDTLVSHDTRIQQNDNQLLEIDQQIANLTSKLENMKSNSQPTLDLDCEVILEETAERIRRENNLMI